MCYGYNKTPVFGWKAQLAWSLDDSSDYYKDRDEVIDVVGELTLWPTWEKRVVRLQGKTKAYDLDVYFRTSKRRLIELFLEMEPGTHLFVSGGLDTRYTNYPSSRWPHLTSELDLNDVAIDESNGEIDAEVALLRTADAQEFTSAADGRFASSCPRCGGKTEEVLKTGVRFCPECDVCRFH